MKNLFSLPLLALILTVSLSPVMAKEIHSSIQVPFVNGTPDGKEEANTQKLVKLAKITKAKARKIASQKYKGKFGKVVLENEDGNLIWSVEVGKHELTIDAGNGNILADE